MHGKNAATVEAYRSDLTKCSNFTEGKPLRAVTLADIRGLAEPVLCPWFCRRPKISRNPYSTKSSSTRRRPPLSSLRGRVAEDLTIVTLAPAEP